MATSNLVQGSLICSAGEQLKQISFITKGAAEASFNGKLFRFGPGDVIGLCDIVTGVYSRTYTVASDITFVSHPFDDPGDLEALFRDNADAAQVIVNSVCRQIIGFLKYRATLKNEADSIYTLVKEMYPKYEELCNRYAFASKKVDGITEIVPADANDPTKNWIHNYYFGIKDLAPEVQKAFFYRKPGLSYGFFQKATKDINNLLQSFDIYQEYLQKNSLLLLNPSGHDLFSIVADLHFESVNIPDADSVMDTIISQFTEILPKMTYADQSYYNQRLNDYTEVLESKRSEKITIDISGTSGRKQNLVNSLETILGYSGCPEETQNMFNRCVREFTRVSDKGSSDEAVYKLRKDIAKLFYDIYQGVFLKSLKDPAVPTVIKMFLNFGYVDADLAGHKNADFLFSIADSPNSSKEMGIYTITEWLKAIYAGEKAPSRDDFDTDYAGHIREEKAQGRIDEEEAKRRLADNLAKVRFELENVFPIANKVTYGRMATFCPLFVDQNVYRPPDTSLLTPAAFKNTFEEIKSIDFSAYFRQILYTNPNIGIQREYIHKEIMPEIILMPNAGIRGTMWQEMDGRDRNTKPRIFMPIIFMEDLKNCLMRLTAEYRWEYIKRVQGPRWGDITDPSLTSEYFDYLQFYRSNRELSSEVKTTIKSALLRARNNYKSVFVSDYIEWLLYESNGSPRLNKFARKILFMYCPFPAEIRENLSKNPQYTEILRRHDLRVKQRIKTLTNLSQKLTKEKYNIPQEITDEMDFLQL